jgi:hypothetical protein
MTFSRAFGTRVANAAGFWVFVALAMLTLVLLRVLTRSAKR